MFKKTSSLYVAFVSALVIGAHFSSQAQDSTYRLVTSAVPFAAFTPDARSAGMGDAGAAISADANSVYWGAAKLVQADKNFGVSLSYTPWLRNITDDMFFANVSLFKKIGKNQAFGASMMYFDHGVFQARNPFGTLLGDYYANEFYVSGAYSRKLSDNFSMGVNFKYINSSLGSGAPIPGGGAIKPGQTVAGDISAFYHSENIDESTGKGWNHAFAAMISNIGGKINYGGSQSGFIPTNLKLGFASTRHIDAYNKLTLALDINKLMVPTPPVKDASGRIISGKDPDRGTLSGIFGSFADAPNGFGEELREFMIATGAEYWYNDLFAVRAGYFNESRTKGDRKYFTFGIGLKFQQRYGINFAYLMPVRQASPLANTFRISVLVDVFKKEVEMPTSEEQN